MSNALLLMQIGEKYRGTHLKHLQKLVLAKCTEARHSVFSLAMELKRDANHIDRVVRRLQERGFLDNEMRVINK